MAAKNSKGNVGMFNVHLVGQGKGGVGKTVVSAYLTQYLRGRGERVIALSVDPVNQSLVQYEGLGAVHFEISRNGKVDESTFDSLIAKTWEEDATYVIDAGASTFFPFSRYVARNQTEKMLAAHNRRLVVHNVITGGGNYEDTMNGFLGWAELLPDKGTVLWVNEFFGIVPAVDKDVRVTENARSLIGVVFLEKSNDELLSDDLEKMHSGRLTFDQIHDGELGEFSRMRLELYQAGLNRSITKALSRLDTLGAALPLGAGVGSEEVSDVVAG